MGPDLLSLLEFLWGNVDIETNEGAALKAVLPNDCSCCFTEMLLMV